MEGRHWSLTQTGLERNRTSAQTSTTRSAPCSALGEGVGLLFAAASVENGNLAGGNSTSLAFAFRRDTGSSWAPRLRAAEEWLLIEWPRAEAEPTKYWLSTLPANTKLQDLVRLAKQRWIIERDYQELKQELGLGHYEGRGWRGFHLPSTFREWRMGHTKASGDTTQPSISNIGTPPGIASQRPRGLRASGFTTCAIPSSRTWWSAACH